MKSTGRSPWLRTTAIAKSEASHSTVNGSFSSIHFRQALKRSGDLCANFQTQSRHHSGGEMHFSGGQRFYFSREITYPPGVVRKHPKTTFQLFRRLRYWEFSKRTKMLWIRAYGSLRYAVPKKVNFSNGNNRFRVIESEVNFRRGVKKLLKKLPS